MDDQNTPAFTTWSQEALSKFAHDIHERVIELVEINSQLRMDLRKALGELHKYKDDWK